MSSLHARLTVLICGLSLTLATTAVVAALQPGMLDIAQRAIRFSQPMATVKAGETIRYHNQDDVTHNLMVIGADDIPQDQGLQPPGAVVTHKFTEAGTFEVRCAIHPKMKMTVTVTH
jgi:plastocyanin